MPRPSYPNFPFPFYRNYYRTPSTSYSSPQSHISNNSYFTKDKIIHNLSMESDISASLKNNSQYTDSDKDENCRNFREKNKSNKNNDDYLFDLFGLKIYSDDILLVSLIYFLYSEGVKDDSLFLVLILLLLS